MKQQSSFEFLKASRFWAMVIGAVSIYLRAKGFIGEAEMQLIATLTAGFVVVRTVDKNTGEAAIEAAKESSGTTTVTIPSNVSSVTASTE
jgi:hypothetical protein